MKTIKDCDNLYLKCNILLLTEDFKEFRKNSSRNYGLCPIHYLSAPALSQDAIVNLKKVEPELLSYADVYVFFEESTRSGFSYIYQRYSRASNKYLKSYDPNQGSKYIVYFNANNLYGYAMSKFLSNSESKWAVRTGLDLDKYNKDKSEGCDLEVDFEYPAEMRELHNDYLQAPG